MLAKTTQACIKAPSPNNTGQVSEHESGNLTGQCPTTQLMIAFSR